MLAVWPDPLDIDPEILRAISGADKPAVAQRYRRFLADHEAKSLFAGTDIYTQLVHRHAMFHSAASRVAEKINGREFELAGKMLKGADFSYASTQVGVAIIQLKKSVGRRLTHG